MGGGCASCACARAFSRSGGLRRARLTRVRPPAQTAAQNSYEERKKSGFKPVATSDKDTLASIQADIDKKRRFREDAGELGAVGYTYTKYTARERMEMEAAQAAAAADDPKRSRYARPEDFLDGP